MVFGRSRKPPEQAIRETPLTHHVDVLLQQARQSASSITASGEGMHLAMISYLRAASYAKDGGDTARLKTCIDELTGDGRINQDEVRAASGKFGLVDEVYNAYSARTALLSSAERPAQE